jgi:hypothetical protein
MVRRLACRMMKVCILTLAISPNVAFAQSQFSTEERFHDLFKTAGYSTAFGAALGAALLSFTPNPAAELRYVAIGASLGFIGGSALGTWMIFQPMFVENRTSSSSMLLAANDHQTGTFVLTPAFERNRPASGQGGVMQRFSGIQGSLTLARF